ncbi:hypothetical protein SAMN05192574_118106 [Mucilaginibacter gossypiicola]|jgi:hypothetical protein|uniref:Uncharacterized protein n=1 Tax=Mucilaginibacter gossypiicola TaxID=551995 RepID=A0A1H8U9P5_9SPHI|nr:hypothetical protein SAMN05192574_118106 [Mucilaginibacter gossypiicola]
MVNFEAGINGYGTYTKVVVRNRGKSQTVCRNFKELQRSLFLFKTGLSNVNGKIKSTAESYVALIQSEKLERTQETTVDLILRRAS